MTSKELSFQVEGTEIYDVDFIREGDVLTAFCSCPAGENGSYCKHRVNLLHGDDDAIVEGEDQLDDLAEMLKGSNLETALKDFDDAVAAVERAQRAKRSATKRLSRLMFGHDLE